MTVTHGVHNHGLPTILKGHAIAGQMTEGEKKMARWMKEIGTPPKSIGYGLRQLDETSVTSLRSLTNTLNMMVAEERGSRTMTQDTLHHLRERGYYYEFRRHPDDDNVLSDLFLAHPDGIRLLRRFHYVIIMDSTYKTNA